MVTNAVDLTKAALFYYFPDKRSLYDATLKFAFEPLTLELSNVLAAPSGTAAERIEWAVEAWIDAISTRPALARLILHHVASVRETPPSDLISSNEELLQNFWSLFEKGLKSGELRPIHGDPFHAASSVIGTTVFYVAGLAALIPQGGYSPLAPKQLAGHKHQSVTALRNLLGISNLSHREIGSPRPKSQEATHLKSETNEVNAKRIRKPAVRVKTSAKAKSAKKAR